MTKPHAICVFCGSRTGKHASYEKAASDLGEMLADHGIRLVYGGGSIGLMGVLARAAHAGGGTVSGVIPQSLATIELHYTQADESVITENMHERRHEMYVRADAFVVLPGGVGTLEETLEVLSWAYLGIHTKPIILLNIEGYWDPLIGLFQHCIDQGFSDPSLMDGPQSAQLLVTDQVSEILPLIEQALSYQTADS